MARSVEVLITGDESTIGTAVVTEAAEAARQLGMDTTVSRAYIGKSDWLCLFGVGDDLRNRARNRHVASLRQVACWDLGYIKSGKEPGVSYLRVSVDHNHPWRNLDATPSDSSRLDVLNVQLREDADPNGPVIVIGMGPKSRRHLGINEWEDATLRKARERFPKREVLYRPKPITKRGVKINRDKHINWPTTKLEDIKDVLRGASLVITRHSNVAVDACIAGVPVECEDGAAFWLYRHGAQQSTGARLDFLRRLAWWQYRTDEMREAWKFLTTIYA